MSSATEENTGPADGSVEPAALYALLAATPHTIGELVDFANAMPEAWITPVLLMLGKSLEEDYRLGRRIASRRRRLVIFGALIDRFIFGIEGVPRKRGYHI